MTIGMDIRTASKIRSHKMSNNNSDVTLNREQGEFKKVLGFWPLVFFGVIAMSPTCGIIYYPITQAGTNGYAYIGYIIAAILIALTVLGYQLMVQRVPKAGSAFAYTTYGIGPKIGFMFGWALLIDYALTPMFALGNMAMYFNSIFPEVPEIVWVLICGAIITLVSCVGVKTSVYVEVIVGLFVVLFVVFYICTGLGVIAASDEAVLFSSSTVYDGDLISWSGVFGAASLAILSFCGFDAITTLAEETKLTIKKFGHTLMVAAMVQAVLLILSIFVTSAAKDWTSMSQAELDVTYMTLLGEWTTPSIANVLVILTQVCVLTVIIAFATASSRILYSMGCSGIFPKKFFGHLSVRFGTPTYSALLVCIVSIVGAIVFDWEFIANLVSFGACVGFIGVNLSVIVKFWIKEKQRNVFRMLIAPAIAILGIFYVLINQNAVCLIVGCIWIIVGAAYLAIRYKTNEDFRNNLNSGNIEM